jgi:hypothetical protein
MDEIKFFEYDREALSDPEQRVLDILIEIGILVHSIWLKQLNPKTGKAQFYPEGTTRTDIINAAKSNPDLLSPYTKVVLEEGKYKAIPYSELYKPEIDKIIGLLEDASKQSAEQELNAYLGAIASALRNGEFDELEYIFVQNQDTKLEIMIGPIETYEDKLLSKKKAFQYNLRILRENKTHEAEEMISVMKEIQILRPEKSLSKDLLSDKINIRVDHVVMLAGRQSRILLSSSNHPNNPIALREYGSKIVVFTTSMAEKFDDRLMPLLSKLKSGDSDQRIDSLRDATFRLVALHEITEGIVKYEDMQDRLGRHQDYIRELNADILGVHSAKYHVLNGAITNEQYKDLLTMFIVFAVDTCNRYEQGGSIEEYSKGFAIAFNFFEKTGAVTFKSRKIDIDYTKLSRDIEVLANIVLQIMEEGSEEDAEELLEDYGDFSIFSKLPKN